jgi:hypothetical protein
LGLHHEVPVVHGRTRGEAHGLARTAEANRFSRAAKVRGTVRIRGCATPDEDPPRVGTTRAVVVAVGALTGGF